MPAMEHACGANAQALAAVNIVERERDARVGTVATQDIARQRIMKFVIGLGRRVHGLAFMEARIDALLKLRKGVEPVAGDAFVELFGCIGMAMISDIADA
ncbi:hypothetical protein KNHN1_12390 [Pseudomonas guariconensis]